MNFSFTNNNAFKMSMTSLTLAVVVATIVLQSSIQVVDAKGGLRAKKEQRKLARGCTPEICGGYVDEQPPQEGLPTCSNPNEIGYYFRIKDSTTQYSYSLRDESTYRQIEVASNTIGDTYVQGCMPKNAPYKFELHMSTWDSNNGGFYVVEVENTLRIDRTYITDLGNPPSLILPTFGCCPWYGYAPDMSCLMNIGLPLCPFQMP